MQDVGVGQVIPIRSDSDELLNFVVGRKRFDRGIVRETHALYGGIFAFTKSEIGGGPGTFSIW